MSANGETSVVLRGITHGAVDYLLKPVRIEELRNIWQHVVRRRREHSSAGSPPRDEPEERGSAGKAADKSGSRKEKKRKDGDGDAAEYAEVRPRRGSRLGARSLARAAHARAHIRKGSDSSCCVASQEEATQQKKPRVVWSVELHQQFVNAVNSLGIDKAVPKRILDLMGVQGLTRENVASHLQKYRLYLKRLQNVQAEDGGRAAAAAAATAAPQVMPHAPPPPLPPVAPHTYMSAPAPPPPPMGFEMHLPGTAPGGGYPAHLLPLGGLNESDALSMVFAPSGAAPMSGLASDIQAVSQLDMGINGLSMDALGGDELMALGEAPGSVPAPGGAAPGGRLHLGVGLGGGMVTSPSADDMLKLFLKDALPEADDATAL